MDERKIDILEFIPFGRENAVSRSYLRDVTGCCDRDMRRLIEEARNEVPIINLQDGRGYYRPNDKEELTRYIFQEQSRAQKILRNIRVACKEYNKIIGQLTFDTESDNIELS